MVEDREEIVIGDYSFGQFKKIDRTIQMLVKRLDNKDIHEVDVDIVKGIFKEMGLWEDLSFVLDSIYNELIGERSSVRCDSKDGYRENKYIVATEIVNNERFNREKRFDEFHVLLRSVTSVIFCTLKISPDEALRRTHGAFETSDIELSEIITQLKNVSKWRFLKIMKTMIKGD